MDAIKNYELIIELQLHKAHENHIPILWDTVYIWKYRACSPQIPNYLLPDGFLGPTGPAIIIMGSTTQGMGPTIHVFIRNIKMHSQVVSSLWVPFEYLREPAMMSLNVILSVKNSQKAPHIFLVKAE